MMNPVPVRGQDKAAPRAAEPRPMPGGGLMLQSNALGFAISKTRGPAFHHPFTVGLGAMQVTVSRGVVDGKYEPTINGVPISGPVNGGSAPFLDLKFDAVKDGQSWIVLEVVPNAQGRLDDQSKVTIEHRGQNLSADDNLGRCPVALLVWQNKQPVRCLQALFFNVQYNRVTLPVGQGPALHIFR